MTGNFVDTIRFKWKSSIPVGVGYSYLETDYGKIRVFDNKTSKPVIINVPDGPNIIEHQLPLIKELAKDYRVVCFEYPGLGFSFPNTKFDYSFKSGANLLLQLMDLLKISKASLLFSCSNGFYALQAARDFPQRFNHIFLSQTPSTLAMLKWTEKSIPTLLKIPIVGQLTNAAFAKKFAKIWYDYALPRGHLRGDNFAQTAVQSLNNGGCFCLSSLVIGLKKDRDALIDVVDAQITMIWGAKDFTHRKTDKDSIKQHARNCEIIEFMDCGHFPELENVQKCVELIKERTS